MKHTPGPWTHDGMGVVMGVRQKVAGGYGHREPICTINTHLDEALANTHLIIAVPDLLEALKDYVALDNARRAGCEITDDDWAEVYGAAVEAIRRTE